MIAGPKDLPMIARTAGRLAGRAIGYVQLARGQFENVMQQSQARQVFPLDSIFLFSEQETQPPPPKFMSLLSYSNWENYI